VKATGKWPSEKDRLAMCAMIYVNTELERLRSSVGKTLRGDVFDGFDDNNFCTSPSKTGSNALRGRPVCG
jgi:hypothetical protein